MRVGIVGVGSMGQNHARILAEVADLAAVCDANVQIGKEVAARFGASFSPDHRELFRQDLDAVTIATPTGEHYEVAKGAIERGLHVLLEKPFCADADQAAKLTEKAADQGVVLAAGMVERHNPAVEFTHKALGAGEYGKVITIASRRVSTFPTRIRDVGVMMDLGIHDVDVMRFLVGEEVARVYAVGGREKHEAFEDHATALLTFANGVDGVVEVNWLTPMKVRKLSLTCLENFVELDYINQSLVISASTLGAYDPADLYEAKFEHEVREVSLKKEEPLRREIEDFLRAVKERGTPLVDGREATETLRIIEAATESHRLGAPVELA